MVLFDLDEHDLAVIDGGLNTLVKLCPESSESNNVQETIEKIQEQLKEIKNWQTFWKEMNPADRKVIDGTLGVAFFLLQKNIDSLDVSLETTELVKNVTFRCELKRNETPKISGCVPD